MVTEQLPNLHLLSSYLSGENCIVNLQEMIEDIIQYEEQNRHSEPCIDSCIKTYAPAPIESLGFSLYGVTGRISNKRLLVQGKELGRPFSFREAFAAVYELILAGQVGKKVETILCFFEKDYLPFYFIVSRDQQGTLNILTKRVYSLDYENNYVYGVIFRDGLK